MTGAPRTGRTTGRHAEFTYYRCPHDPANPRRDTRAAQLKALIRQIDIAQDSLWNKDSRQATIHAEITANTLRALPGILDPDQDGYHAGGVGGPRTQEGSRGATESAAAGPATPVSTRG